MKKIKFIKLIFLVDTHYLNIGSHFKSFQFDLFTSQSFQFEKQYNINTNLKCLFFQLNYLLFIYIKYFKKENLFVHNNNQYGVNILYKQPDDSAGLIHQNKFISGYKKVYLMNMLYNKNKDITNFDETYNINYIISNKMITYTEKIDFIIFKPYLTKSLIEFNSVSLKLNKYFFFFWVNFL